MVAPVAIRRLAAKSRWPLVMEPHQDDSGGRGGDDARAYGRFEVSPPKKALTKSLKKPLHVPITSPAPRSAFVYGGGDT